MSGSKTKWNPPSWPWELELITFAFFIVALLVPYYFHNQGLGQSAEEIREVATQGGLAVGENILSTQIGFLLSVGIAALYVFHLAVSFGEISRVTASPVHLLSPCVFAVLAYYRIDGIPNIRDTALGFIDGSILQVAILLVSVGLITSILARLRTYLYLESFDDVPWDIISPAPYNSSFGNLLLQWRPLLYPPRRYRACQDGIMIEGWFYAMPIGFNDVHALSLVSNSSSLNSGHYYASSTHHLIRLELHDSLKPTYISPMNREEFARYCAQHTMRKTPSHRASPTRHGVLRASDTHSFDKGAGQAAGSTASRKPPTRHGP